MLVDSDVQLSPQALILSPESTIRVASAIVGKKTHYHQTVAAARAAVEIIREAIGGGRLSLPPRESNWLSKIEEGIDDLPTNEDALINEMSETYSHLFLPSSYAL
jgi:methanol--5-hydroxybenzimidazolylcobamide Co-methyltransferase